MVQKPRKIKAFWGFLTCMAIKRSRTMGDETQCPASLFVNAK